MKILILTSSPPNKYSGIVASDLYKGLKSINGNEVRILTKFWDRYDDKNIIPIDSDLSEYWRRLWDLRRRFVKKLLKVLFNYKINEGPEIKTDRDYSIQGVDQTVSFYKTSTLLKRVGFKPDAIIVLFMPHFISFKNLYELNQIAKAPVLLYFMDMAPMTGGCHYAWDCKAYTNKCGNCPALFSDNDYDQTRINWEYKKKYIDKTEIITISGTEWQYRQLQRSSLFADKPKHKILLGVDGELFKPGNKVYSRNYFNLPLDKKIIFFGAVYFDRSRNKGFKELIEGLRILKDLVNESANFHLAIAGYGSSELNNIFPFEHTYLGYLNHKQLSVAFRASDVFVSPSIEDSGPMMINQSIMSGTPVVAFEMGVATDLVISGYTGYRASLRDCADLAKGIKSVLVLNELKYLKMSENCRNLGLELCNPPIQIRKFIEIFESHLEKKYEN